MKKIISYILCVCMLLGMASAAFAYSDITEDYDWAKEAIRVLSEKNTLNGYPDGTFLPEQNVTRAELAKMVCTLLGNGDSITYADVTETDWFYPYVSQSGGYFTQTTAFYPNRPATREEVAFAVYSALNLKEHPTDKKISFSDQADITSTYLAGIKFLNEQEVLTGYPDGSFRPQNPITRAETAVILYRADLLKALPSQPVPEEKEETTSKAINYFFLVNKVATIVDESGEIVTRVTGYNNGVPEEILLSDQVNIQHSSLSANEPIKAGDVLSFTRDLFGTIRTVNVGVNVSNLPRAWRIELLVYGNTTNRQVLYGIVDRRYKEKGIELRSTDDTTSNLYTLAEDVNVYLWKNGKIELSDLYEINDSTYETGDKVLAFCYNDEISEIVIIKE